jgi:mono/diheme cytochrome c family protein
MRLLPRLTLTGILLGGLVLATAAPAAAADEKVTYYEHVARILQANCVSCHKPAGKNIGSLVAPMSLTT